jgi:hypothetical protein
VTRARAPDIAPEDREHRAQAFAFSSKKGFFALQLLIVLYVKAINSCCLPGVTKHESLPAGGASGSDEVTTRDRDEVTTRDEIKDGMMRPPHLLDV